MAKAKKAPPPEDVPEEIKNQLIRVARRHFALHGFHGASLKDIAIEVGVANSLINYHFQDKAGLFRACMETFAHNQMAAIQRILGEARTAEEIGIRIQLFVEEMQSSILADPHSYEIIHREMRAGNQAVMKFFKESIVIAFDSVVEFFRKAKERGLLRSDVDPKMAAILLFSTTCESLKHEVLTKKFFNISFSDPECRSHFAKQVVGLFTNGVVK